MKYKIFNEDCIKTMERLSEKGLKVDVILTSPPYNISRVVNTENALTDHHNKYKYYKDNKKDEDYLNLDIGSIQGFDNIKQFFIENKDIFMDNKKVITFDIETKNLNLRNNVLLGFGIGFSKTKSRYIITRDLSIKQLKTLFKVFNKFKCKIALHNSYFDISQLNYMLGFKIKWDFCTYIMAHCLHTDILLRAEDKDRGTSLSLKELCKFYYNELYGYEDELEKEKMRICKEKGIIKDKFTYDMFSDETLVPYGNYDVLVTYALYESFMKEIKDNVKNGWEKLPYLLDLKHKVTNIYINAKVKGIRVDRKKVLELNNQWNEILQKNYNEIINNKEIKDTENLLYMREYKKVIDKRQLEFEKKLNDRLEKIKQGKYTKEKLLKDKEKVNQLTLKMLENIENKSKFNLKSPNHKATLFIDVMGLTPIKYNEPNKRTGEKTPKTDKEFMKKYSHIPLVDKIREYALYVKGVDGFLGVNDESGEKGLWNLTSDDYPFNHPNSNLQGTITHRVAQNSINLQQLPSRGDLSVLKKCIIPLQDNHRIIALDYSSCELYILGALSEEPNLVNAIKDGLDLHSNMAYEVWGGTTILEKDKLEEIETYLQRNVGGHREQSLTLADLSISLTEKLAVIRDLMGDMRYNAKSINFGTPYGIGAKGLAENMKKSVKEAEKMLDEYMSKNVKIKEFMDKNKDFLCKNGYVEGTHGQRLYMNNSKGVNWRELKDWKYEDKKYILEELRKSTNYIIQSENAMVIYEALVRFDKKIKELGWENDVFILTTIYDACYLSVDKKISDKEIKKVLTEVFEVWYNKDVKFKIDVESGQNFKDLQPIE